VAGAISFAIENGEAHVMAVRPSRQIIPRSGAAL
jgi:hypothetical protein